MTNYSKWGQNYQQSAFLMVSVTMNRESTRIFNIFYTISTKMLFLLNFQTFQIIEYGPQKFFSSIPYKNIRFYVAENEKKC